MSFNTEIKQMVPSWITESGIHDLVVESFSVTEDYFKNPIIRCIFLTQQEFDDVEHKPEFQHYGKKKSLTIDVALKNREGWKKDYGILQYFAKQLGEDYGVFEEFATKVNAVDSSMSVEGATNVAQVLTEVFKGNSCSVAVEARQYATDGSANLSFGAFKKFLGNVFVAKDGSRMKEQYQKMAEQTGSDPLFTPMKKASVATPAPPVVDVNDEGF